MRFPHWKQVVEIRKQRAAMLNDSNYTWEKYEI